MKYLIHLILIAVAISCSPPSPDSSADDTTNQPEIITDSAAWVVAQAVKRHGGDALDSSQVDFVFRDRRYSASREGHRFVYSRQFTNDKGESIGDYLSNDGFYREVNQERVSLSAKDSSSYSNSVNSVHYFAYLPYFLNDPAVNMTYHGTTDLLGGPHYKIGVTFEQAGGGKDFEDEFAYWIHAEDFTMDFLAYNYLTNEGGARFREAYNAREISGIRFQDYINYKPQGEERDVLNFDALFQAAQLDTLSLIELEDITVKLQ